MALMAARIVNGHHAPQPEGRQLFDKRFGKSIRFAGQQLFELLGPVEAAAVDQLAGGVHRRIGSLAGRHLLFGAPATDRVVIVEGEAERIDLLMARSADRVRRVRFQLHAIVALG